jgi:hypothetical protein
MSGKCGKDAALSVGPVFWVFFFLPQNNYIFAAFYSFPAAFICNCKFSLRLTNPLQAPPPPPAPSLRIWFALAVLYGERCGMCFVVKGEHPVLPTRPPPPRTFLMPAPHLLRDASWTGSISEEHLQSHSRAPS